jgi:hypothetical protein
MAQGGAGFKRFGLDAARAARLGHKARYLVHKATKATDEDIDAVSFVAFAMA